MPFRPYNEAERALAEKELLKARETAAVHVEQVKRLESELAQGVWYMENGEVKTMYAQAEKITREDEERSKKTRQRREKAGDKG